MISTDTDELLKLSDKISVIHKGKLSKIMNAEEVTSEKLGVLMGGGLKLIKFVKRDQPSRAIFFLTPVLAIIPYINCWRFNFLYFRISSLLRRLSFFS